MGWRQYAGKAVEDAEKNAEAGDLPELSEGMTLELAGVDLKEGKTSPPKRFTEDLLLSAMESASSDEFPAGVERKGIGTPATRAAIIEKLVQKGFIERRGDKKNEISLFYGQGKCAGDGGAGTDSVPIHDGRLGGKTAENRTRRVRQRCLYGRNQQHGQRTC